MLKRMSLFNQLVRRKYSKSSSWRNSEKSNSPAPPSSDSQGVSQLYHARPTDMERKILVYSGKYKSYEDIPEKISPETIDKAKSMLRIRVSNIMIVLTLIGFAYSAWSGKKMAREGKTLAKLAMEEQERLMEEGRQARKKTAGG